MEQKFGTAVAISERLIHIAYNNRLAPGALHHEALTEIVKYVNEIPQNSHLLSFVHQPSDLFLVETSYIYKLDKTFFVLVLHIPLVTPHNSCRCMSYSTSGPLQLLRQHFCYTRVRLHKHDRSLTLPIVPTSLLYGLAILQQDGGDLLLQGKECPPNGPHQDMPWHPLPRGRQKHPGPVQILYRRGSGKYLLFGRQQVCGED
jgi:hypothetical protein